LRAHVFAADLLHVLRPATGAADRYCNGSVRVADLGKPAALGEMRTGLAARTPTVACAGKDQDTTEEARRQSGGQSAMAGQRPAW
ncbi:hypothetical protein ACFOHR_21500, partial [Xanthomonas perforans]|uniref:hypothetical protein n=1 Tax=Xanthomonas perforans TaxID=442694 RepID=UPI00360DBB73